MRVLRCGCDGMSVDVFAQRKTKKKPAPAPPTSELSKLREEFIKATNEYKASLGKLLPFYESDVKKAEEKLELSKKLLAEGLIPRTQVEENERALALAKEKIAETNRQMASAEAQIAGVLVETAANEEINKEPASRKATPGANCCVHSLHRSGRLEHR